MIDFSLIIGTLNRKNELFSCLESISLQSFTNYEVIIVDQSDNDETMKLVDNFGLENVKYTFTDIKGLSRARNIGINQSSGRYICLLDDDAIYPPDYLENIYKLINNKKIISGVIFSVDDYKTPFIDCGAYSDRQIMSISGILEACPSATLTFPRSLVSDIGGFNERLGVGNDFAAGEETEFLLRAIDEKYSVVHSKEVIAYHPIKPIDYKNLTTIYKHAMGKGALYKIECKRGHWIRLSIFAAKNTFGMIIKMLLSNQETRKYFRTRLSGFVNGYKKYEL